MVKIFSIFLLLMMSGGWLWANPPESEVERLERENRELREK